eukprot:4722086-Pleurochrysis_carterae.AAC.1
MCLSKDTYGADYPKPFRFVSHADHPAFKECAQWKQLRLELSDLLKKGHESAVVRSKKEEQRLHSEWYERTARARPYAAFLRTTRYCFKQV